MLTEPKKNITDLPDFIRRAVWIILLSIMTVELILLLHNSQWENAFVVTVIMAITSAPIALGRKFKVYIPPEFHVLAIIFVFSALFLGEFRGYYEWIWWWDMALHISSGLLMGVLGFLLVYVLNESEHVNVHMRPGFVALFACLFAIAAGTFWEVFEFAMDQMLGLNMQKPMFGDISGLTDTMWDMIVNSLGAIFISTLGWWFLSHQKQSFIEAWIRKFIDNNPQLFRNRA